MPDASRYAIRGGLQGRERLRVMSRVLHPTTTSLFERLGVVSGQDCLDVGCGGGDVTLELARLASPGGSAMGVDIDEAKVTIARNEAAETGCRNVEFRCADIRADPIEKTFDVIYARFLLTHLSDPAAALRAFHDHLNPAGMLIVEDIDFRGYFNEPESKAFERYQELYYATVVPRGGDPNIGPRLPGLLKQAGLSDVGMSVVQHAAMEGDVKLISALTMENIADSVIADGLATRAEIDDIVRELYELAANPDSVGSTPRIVQSWGRRPAA